ncbi:MAG: tetratricopeptide (TPR) repeat protein [Planctomycetota bacterium]|jgi:tetratricopeptide (TPR) repeat protein
MIRPRLLGLALLTLLIACSSTPDGELTDKQKLGLYLENAGRYYELGEIERCLDQCYRGLAIQEDNERFLLIQGRCHQHLGTSRDIAIAEQIFRDHPAQDDFRVRLGLAAALERKGLLMSESAVVIRSGERYTEAADPEARADDLLKLSIEAWEESIEAYLDAERLFTGSFEALNGLMRVSRYQGKNNESLAYATTLLDSIEGSNKLFRVTLTENEAKGESSVSARRTLLDNQELETFVRLESSELLHGFGRSDEALAQLDQALSLDPNMTNLHSRRGQLLFEMKRYSRAKSALERFLSLSNEPFDHPDIRGTYALIAQCDTALGRR